MANTTQFILETAFGSGVANAGFTLANFNSLAVGSCVVATNPITYSGGVDPYMDVSFLFVVGGTTVLGDFLALYVLPLNGVGGGLYGDGTVSGANLPAEGYYAGSIGVLPNVASGSAIVGMFRGIIAPVENFKLVIANMTSVPFGTSALAAVSYNTYRENLNA